MNNLFSRNRMTFKPQKEHRDGSKRQQLHNYTRRTLGTGYIRQAVELPAGEELNEWMALHTVDFYNAVSLLVGIASDEHAPRLEPGWGFPPGFEYLWADVTTRKTVKCSGPEYVEYVMNWIEGVLNDEHVFPSTTASCYPKDFEKTCKGIFKRMFRVFAILYTHFYHTIENRGAIAHLNTTFKHYLFFCFEFDLLPACELEAIDTLVQRLKEEYIVQGKKP